MSTESNKAWSTKSWYEVKNTIYIHIPVGSYLKLPLPSFGTCVVKVKQKDGTLVGYNFSAGTIERMIASGDWVERKDLPIRIPSPDIEVSFDEGFKCYIIARCQQPPGPSTCLKRVEGGPNRR